MNETNIPSSVNLLAIADGLRVLSEATPGIVKSIGDLAKQMSNLKKINVEEFKKSVESMDPITKSVVLFSRGVAELTTSVQNIGPVSNIKMLNDAATEIFKPLTDLSKQMSNMQKINAKELKKSVKSIDDIVWSINKFSQGISSLTNAIAVMAATGDKEVQKSRQDLIEFLCGAEGTTDKAVESKKNGDIVTEFTTEITTGKKTGFFDILTKIAELGNVMDSIKFTNPIKFKLKFNQTIKLFQWQYKKLQDLTSLFSPETIKLIDQATQGLQQVLMALPMSVSKMGEMFATYGKPAMLIATFLGMKMLLGEKMDGTGGMVNGTLLMTQKIQNFGSTINLTAFTNFDNALKDLSIALNRMTKTFVLLTFGAPFIYIGMLILFGKGGKGGIIKGLIDGLEFVAQKSKEAQNATKSLVYVSLAILALAGAIALMALAGAIAIMGWKQIGVTVLFTLLLVGLFILIGWAKKAIDDGEKELLQIAGVIGILTITAVVVVYLGQFLKAEWDSILQVGVMLMFLVVGFIFIGLVSKYIEKGSKEMLWIALTVGILALIAVALVWISNYIKGEWESICQIGVMLAFVVGAFIGIGLLHKQIENGKNAMILVMVCAAVLALVVLLYAYIADTYDMLKTLWAAGIMILIVGAIGAACWAAGMLKEKITEGLEAMAIIVGTCILLSMVMMTLARAVEIADPLNILYVTGIMLLIVLAVGGIAFACASFVLGPQGIAFLAGCGAVATIGALALELAAATKNIAEAAKAVDESGYTDPEELATILKLPIQAIMLPTGKDEKSVFDTIKEIPSSSDMAVVTYKVKCLQWIVSSIGGMADTLQHIASLNMPDPTAGYDKDGNPLGWKQMKAQDFANASQNASVILGMCAAMFADTPQEFTISNDEKAEKFKVQVVDTAWIDKIGLMTTLKVNRLKRIVSNIGDMADTLQHIASLNMPIEWNQEGKATKYKQMEGDDFVKAAQNASSILKLFANLFDDKPSTIEVEGKPVQIININMDALDNVSRSMRRKVERLGEIVAVVGNMSDTIQKVASLAIPNTDETNGGGFTEEGKPKAWRVMNETDFTTAATNVGKIITTLVGAVADPTLSQQLEDMDEDAAENFEKILNPMANISAVVDMVQMLANDEYVISWETDENGNQVPKEKGKFSTLLESKPVIQERIKSILSIVVEALSPFNHGDLESKLHDAEDEIEDIQKVVDGVKPCVEGMLDVYKNNLEDLKTSEFTSKFSTVSYTIKNLIGALKECDTNAASKGLDVLGDMVEPLSSMITLYREHLADIEDASDIELKFGALTTATTNIMKILGAQDVDKRGAMIMNKNIVETTNLLKQVDKVDVNKLKVTNGIMKHIAELSKSIRGDFKALAKVLNEDLLEALEKLTQAFEKVGNMDLSNVGNAPTSMGDATPDKSGTEGVSEKPKPDKNKPQNEIDKVVESLNKLTTKLGELSNLSKMNFEDGALKVTSKY